MIQELKNSITQNFDNIDFNLVDWYKVLHNSSNVLIYHLESLVDYYVVYFQGENLSFVLHKGDKIVGVFPLFVHRDNGNWVISGNGQSLVNPLFINGIAKKTKKLLEKKIVNIVYFIANKLDIKTFELFDHNTELSSWYMLWLQRANKSFLTHQIAINLCYSISEIKVSFRRSYKTLINKALREWDISICDNNLDEDFEAFRLLHLEVAGRVTRSIKSWNIQKKQIENNEAFLVTVKDNGNLIGAALFTYTKDFASYSVSVFKRELFDKPIGHGVQIKAIEFLKEKGCKTYHIGQKVTLLDRIKPTEKELSISHFKDGFSGYTYIQPHLEVNVNE